MRGASHSGGPKAFKEILPVLEETMERGGSLFMGHLSPGLEEAIQDLLLTKTSRPLRKDILRHRILEADLDRPNFYRDDRQRPVFSNPRMSSSLDDLIEELSKRTGEGLPRWLFESSS